MRHRQRDSHLQRMARLDFRSFFVYGLLFAAIWFVDGTLVFTFAPC